MAASRGPNATHTYSWGGKGYSSANLFHPQNIACKAFEQDWENAPNRGTKIVASVDFPFKAFTALRNAVNARTPTTS